MSERNHFCCTENLSYRVSLVPPAKPGSVNPQKVVFAAVDYVGSGYVMVKGVVESRLYYRCGKDGNRLALAETPFYFRIEREDARPGDGFLVVSAAVIDSRAAAQRMEAALSWDYHEAEDIIKICIAAKDDRIAV